MNAADAPVDVAKQAVFLRKRGDVLDWIDNAMRVAGRGPHEQDRILRNERAHRIDVGPVVDAALEVTDGIDRDRAAEPDLDLVEPGIPEVRIPDLLTYPSPNVSASTARAGASATA